MITKETIDNILEAAKIEDVIGDFVVLKKRGANYLGLCPFHNEKTPSFVVSPAKGIYKCFGCQKSGNSVGFMMDHESYTYPQSLKYIADKFGVEVEEEEQTPEQIKELNERESVYNILDFANKYFGNNLFETEKGKAIGLSYFKERGFTEEIIKKFQLGYSFDDWDALSKHALENGYTKDYLVKSGLAISKEDKHYDRFRSRVLFPIHNLSGRVLGFSGRILGDNKNMAKYVNSPESDVYQKRRVLYGLYFAKNAIVTNNNCFLVEGNADVVSLSQSGVQNVVAVSGTSLTIEQTRLIKRFTSNVTFLFDGDVAGSKAALRGIDMMLEEEFNVKIVVFPEGEDPDSYARKREDEEVQKFITEQAVDFISYKADLLMKGVGNDPAGRAGVIKEIVRSIALIPDGITRTVFVRECSSRMEIPEQTLSFELNKIRRKNLSEKHSKSKKQQASEEFIPDPIAEKRVVVPEKDDARFKEVEIIKLLLNYAAEEIVFEEIREDETKESVTITLGNFIVTELSADEISFKEPICQLIYEIYLESIGKGAVPNIKTFIHHEDANIATFVASSIAEPYTLSENWEKMHGIIITSEREKLKQAALSNVYALKLKRVEERIEELQNELKGASEEDIMINLSEIKRLNEVKKIISKQLGNRIVIK